MRKLTLIIACLLLCACSNISVYKKQFDDIFADDVVSENRANNYTEYIEYYVPSDINEESSEPLSFSFAIDDCKIIMNVNIANIINSKDFKNSNLVNDGFFDEDKLIYTHEGQYTNINKEKINYFFKAYEYEDKYLMYLVSSEVNVYGYCPKNKSVLLAEKIIQLASGANVNNNKVITNYSSKDVIDYNKKTVDLFENVYPVEGRVEDMMVDPENKVPEQ